MTNFKEPTHFVSDDRLTDADKELMADLNAALDRIGGLRAVEINVSGKFALSKIGSKVARSAQVVRGGKGASINGTSRPSSRRRKAQPDHPSEVLAGMRAWRISRERVVTSPLE
jgi:hypothetical protein